jgi:hypothetical protein
VRPGYVDPSRVLHGSLVRDDIPAAAPNPCPALELANVRGRTIAPTENLDALWQRLETSGQRRIAVVDDANTLPGLVCLKRDRTGFCTDDDVRSRTVTPTLSAARIRVRSRRRFLIARRQCDR